MKLLVFIFLCSSVSNVNAGSKLMTVGPETRSKFKFRNLENVESEKEVQFRAIIKNRIEDKEKFLGRVESKSEINAIREETIRATIEELQLTPLGKVSSRSNRKSSQPNAISSEPNESYENSKMAFRSNEGIEETYLEPVLDSAGFSIEDWNVIFANYKRTSRVYERKEEDELFEVISKAYVRNFQKLRMDD